jgi:uncharacterized membrane protein
MTNEVYYIGLAVTLVIIFFLGQYCYNCMITRIIGWTAKWLLTIYLVGAPLLLFIMFSKDD